MQPFLDSYEVIISSLVKNMLIIQEIVNFKSQNMFQKEKNYKKFTLYIYRIVCTLFVHLVNK